MSQRAAETPAFHPPLGHKTLEIRGPRREPGDTTGWCAPEPLTVCLPLPGEPRRRGAPTAYSARGRVAEASLAALCPQRHPHPGDGGLQGLLDGRFTAASPATSETPSGHQGRQGLPCRVTLNQPQSQRRCRQPWRASSTHAHTLWGPGPPPALAGQQQPQENWPPVPPDRGGEWRPGSPLGAHQAASPFPPPQHRAEVPHQGDRCRSSPKTYRPSHRSAQLQRRVEDKLLTAASLLGRGSCRLQHCRAGQLPQAAQGEGLAPGCRANAGPSAPPQEQGAASERPQPRPHKPPWQSAAEMGHHLRACRCSPWRLTEGTVQGS